MDIDLEIINWQEPYDNYAETCKSHTPDFYKDPGC